MSTPFTVDDLDDFDGPDPDCDCEDCDEEREFAAITAQLTGVEVQG